MPRLRKTTRLRTSSSDIFRYAATSAGATVKEAWTMDGPSNTAIAWLTMYIVNGRCAIVQTYKDGGWEVFTAGGSLDVDVTIRDALARCGVEQNKA